jgi:hypothetical protein
VKLLAATLVLFAPWLLATSARADGPAVLVLQGGATLAAEHDRLVEALRIYTRDRDGVVLSEGGAPAQPTSGAVAEAVARARARGAAIVAWTGRRADGAAVYYVLTAARGELRETEIAPLGAERTAVDVALKVRALLPPAAAAGATASDTAAPARVPPPDAAAPTAAPPVARASESPPRPPAAGPPAPPPPGPAQPSAVARVVVSGAPEEPPLPEPRFALTAGYGLFVPSDPAWRRGGLVLAAELRAGGLAGAPLSVFVDGAITERPSQTVRGFEVGLRDTPVGAGALLRSRWGRWGAALGPRASVHVLDIDAASATDARSGGARRYAAGLGGRFELDLRLFAYMKATVGASLEGLIPTQEFTLGGQAALGTGRVLAGFSAGLALLIL